MKASARLVPFALLMSALAGCASSDNPTGSPPAPALPAPAGKQTPTQNDTHRPPAAVTNAAGAIRPVNGMGVARAAHAATLLQNGRVLITGGFGQGDNTYADSAEIYDPATADFLKTGRLTIRRCCHTATRLPDGRVLIAGGFNGDYLSDAELYDPQTGRFTPTGSLTTARMDHLAVLLDDGQVLLAGGVGTGWTFLAGAELYDPATGAFTPTGAMTAARESHTLTKLLDGRVLITGGHRGRHSAIVVYASAELYNPATGSFTPTGPMNVPRHKHDAVLLRDGRALVTGGSDERDDQAVYSSAEVFDPATGSFTLVRSMPTIRYKHIGTSLLLPNGEVLIAGGARNAVIFDPRAGQFSLVPGELGTAALSRLFATATLLQNGSVLLLGGYGLGQNVSARAWLYSP